MLSLLERPKQDIVFVTLDIEGAGVEHAAPLESGRLRGHRQPSSSGRRFGGRFALLSRVGASSLTPALFRARHVLRHSSTKISRNTLPQSTYSASRRSMKPVF